MTMRDHMNNVLILSQYRDLLTEQIEQIQDKDGTWITNDGEIVKRTQESCISITTNDGEFIAEWDEGVPSRIAFGVLSRIIQETVEFELYVLRSMPMIHQEQAVAVANSLAQQAR
jgi:hypothetical protein